MKGQKFLKVTSVLMIIGGVIGVIAGIKGIGACNAPQKAAACIKWGIIIAVLSIISMIIGLVAGGEFSFTSLILNLLVPGLYIYGAIQTKNGPLE